MSVVTAHGKLHGHADGPQFAYGICPVAERGIGFGLIFFFYKTSFIM
jgi:hypothetical protein